MNWRAIFLVAFAFLFSAGPLCAGEPAPLPSKKANVVMPLLEQFSPKKTSKKEVLEQIDKILGGGAVEIAGGSPNFVRDEFYYTLDDMTKIVVRFVNDQLRSITARLPDQSTKEIYPLVKK